MIRSEEHTSELQSREKLVCRLLLEKKKYIVEYNPVEIALYTMETGIPVLNAPFPIYLQEVEKYIVDDTVPFANSREFTEATWLKKWVYRYLGILK